MIVGRLRRVRWFWALATTAVVGIGLCLAGCRRDAQQADPETVARAFPQGAPEAANPALRIGMQRLARQRRWPLLRRWRRGEELERAPTQSPARSLRELQILGAQVMQTYCVGCHGRQGEGDGPMAGAMTPRPRNFVRGAYKFRSTPAGAAPTVEDIFSVVTGGLRGTRMMPYADLPEEQRWAVAYYLLTLSSKTPAVAVPLPSLPPDIADPVRQARGKLVYAALGCAQCHGESGDGRGPAAEALRRDPRTSPPVNFRQAAYKRGRTAEDTLRTLVTGLDGTVMLSFRQRASDAQLVDLVAYVHSLAER